MELLLFISAVWVVFQLGGYHLVTKFIWKGRGGVTNLFTILFHVPCCIGLIWMGFDALYGNFFGDTWLNRNLYK